MFKILRRFEFNFGQALQVDMSMLNALKFSGDLEVYLDALDSRLSVMIGEPNEHMLLAIVEPELRSCPDLVLESQIFDRAAAGTHESSLSYLYDAARSLCARKRRQKMVDQLKAPPKKVNPVMKPKGKGPPLKGVGPPPKYGKPGGGPPPAPKQMSCNYWRHGDCKFGTDCKMVHIKNQNHTPTAGRPAGTPVTLGAQPRDDCKKFAADPAACTYGGTCMSLHGADDKRDMDKILKLGLT